MQLVLLWGPWIDIVPKSTAQLLFVPKSCYVKNFLQWPHPSKSWNKLILMEHAFDVRFTYNKNMNVLWVVDFGRGVSVCKNRGWNLKNEEEEILSVVKDNCTCFQHPWWPMVAHPWWSVDHISSWTALELSGQICLEFAIMFWKFLLVVVKEKTSTSITLWWDLNILQRGRGPLL